MSRKEAVMRLVQCYEHEANELVKFSETFQLSLSNDINWFNLAIIGDMTYEKTVKNLGIKLVAYYLRKDLSFDYSLSVSYKGEILLSAKSDKIPHWTKIENLKDLEKFI